MNVFFVFPSVKQDMTINHGVASLCGVIKSKGHDVDLYHFDSFSKSELLKKFNEKKYSLCLISSVTNQWPYALKVIKTLRDVSDILIIAGGHHVTHSTNVLKENIELDGICLGEGDIALGELLDRLDSKEDFYNINNLHFRKREDGEIIKNEVGDLIRDLDTLPFPDYGVFSKKSVLTYPALMFSRGCPYNCTYCCNNSLRKLYKGKGKYIRVKSLERAIEELKRLIKDFDPPVINFDDDTFVKNKEWLYSFLDQYRQVTRTPFICNTRPETLSDDLCRRLKEANCKSICVGIESGNEKLRETILKRHMSNESIVNSFNMLKKHGIKVFSFNMVGIPGETYEDYMDTVRLNREIDPDDMQMTIFYPYIGTDLGDIAKEKGYLISDNEFSHSYFSKSILKMEQFPRWKIKYACFFFHFNVYREKSLLRAIYYLFRKNIVKSAFLMKILKPFFGK